MFQVCASENWQWSYSYRNGCSIMQISAKADCPLGVVREPSAADGPPRTAEAIGLVQNLPQVSQGYIWPALQPAEILRALRGDDGRAQPPCQFTLTDILGAAQQPRTTRHNFRTAFWIHKLQLPATRLHGPGSTVSRPKRGNVWGPDGTKPADYATPAI
jgi:hypothetical protein